MIAQSTLKLKKRIVFLYKSTKRMNVVSTTNRSTGDPTTSVTTTATITDPTVSGL